MGSNKPAAFVAALLLMLAGVVTSQLWALHRGVNLCMKQAEIVFQHQRDSGKDPNLRPLDPSPGSGCDRLREDFKESVRENSALVLSLLGGGGVAAAAAHGSSKPKD